MRQTCAWVGAVIMLGLLLAGCVMPEASGLKPGSPASGGNTRQYFPIVAGGQATPLAQATPIAQPTLPPPVMGCPEGCSEPPPGCTIKGSISSTGEKIYRLPGWQEYATTEVDPRFGDRWFCTTAEAVANGWQPSAVR